ncbi:hypothetical protein BC830DRAFT_551012 [Chytriomyces sp. MP71]|nr:hypothetical protein BC830DRAFT_551012 [Chytriomyces sp. MP71]
MDPPPPPPREVNANGVSALAQPSSASASGARPAPLSSALAPNTAAAASTAPSAHRQKLSSHQMAHIDALVRSGKISRTNAHSSHVAALAKQFGVETAYLRRVVSNKQMQLNRREPIPLNSLPPTTSFQPKSTTPNSELPSLVSHMNSTIDVINQLLKSGGFMSADILAAQMARSSSEKQNLLQLTSTITLLQNQVAALKAENKKIMHQDFALERAIQRSRLPNLHAAPQLPPEFTPAAPDTPLPDTLPAAILEIRRLRTHVVHQGDKIHSLVRGLPLLAHASDFIVDPTLQNEARAAELVRVCLLRGQAILGLERALDAEIARRVSLECRFLGHDGEEGAVNPVKDVELSEAGTPESLFSPIVAAAAMQGLPVVTASLVRPREVLPDEDEVPKRARKEVDLSGPAGQVAKYGNGQDDAGHIEMILDEALHSNKGVPEPAPVTGLDLEESIPPQDGRSSNLSEPPTRHAWERAHNSSTIVFEPGPSATTSVTAPTRFPTNDPERGAEDVMRRQIANDLVRRVGTERSHEAALSSTSSASQAEQHALETVRRVDRHQPGLTAGTETILRAAKAVRGLVTNVTNPQEALEVLQDPSLIGQLEDIVRMEVVGAGHANSDMGQNALALLKGLQGFASLAASNRLATMALGRQPTPPASSLIAEQVYSQTSRGNMQSQTHAFQAQQQQYQHQQQFYPQQQQQQQARPPPPQHQQAQLLPPQQQQHRIPPPTSKIRSPILHPYNRHLQRPIANNVLRIDTDLSQYTCFTLLKLYYDGSDPMCLANLELRHGDQWRRVGADSAVNEFWARTHLLAHLLYTHCLKRCPEGAEGFLRVWEAVCAEHDRAGGIKEISERVQKRYEVWMA